MFLSTIQIPLELCNDLHLIATNEKVLSILSAKIKSHNNVLLKQFKSFLNSKDKELPPQFQELITAELHTAVYNNNLARIQFLISKGANPNLKYKNKQSAIDIINERIANTTKIDDNTAAIASAFDIKINIKPAPAPLLFNKSLVVEDFESYENKTPLHTWAQTTPNNIELLQTLLSIYDASTEDPRRDLDNEHGDNFVHALFRNKMVDEAIALKCLSIILSKNDIYLHRYILATKNKNGNTILVLSEIRGWSQVTNLLGQALVNIIEHLLDKQINIKVYFEHARDYFNLKSSNNLIYIKLRGKDYESIQNIIEQRDAIRSNIKNISKTYKFDDEGEFYFILCSIFSNCEYFDIIIDDKSFIDYFNDLRVNGDTDPGILKILTSPLLKTIINDLPITATACWEEIIHICAQHGLNEACIERLNLITKHSQNRKMDPNKTDTNNATMLDYAATLGNIDLIKELISRFNFILKPRTILQACASFQHNDHDNHQILEYLFNLYEKQRADGHDLPCLKDLDKNLELDFLSLAALRGCSVSKIRWLQQAGYSCNKIYLWGQNLLQRIVINTGYCEKSAKLDFPYSYEAIKQLLTQDTQINKQMVTHRDEFGSTALEQVLALDVHSAEDSKILIKIVELLICNGANLLNISNDGQNVLHYIAEFGDESRTKYILDKITKVHGIDQALLMQDQKNNDGITPIMLAKSRVKTTSKIKKLIS